MNDDELSFQNATVTEHFDDKYGDVALTISEQEFYLLGLIEKEVFEPGENKTAFQRVWDFIGKLDAY